MALRNIIQVGDETLAKKSFKVERFDDKLALLLDDMKETLIKANGCGLAAPQVGILRRLFIVDVDEGFFEFVNPEILSVSGSQTGREGCLSVSGKWGTVTRPMYVTIRAQDRFGKPFKVKAEGLFARALCHENDHLDGKLYLDLATDLQDD